ncbi:hypothetical protein [Actomonas aquatica]|uniref:Chalcone isomerase domain-containing protein n=1 Tax=Actomonas aquatica TaxID=2866162 RepID=A0ABZ1CAC4_9BACT|nr:hypothetical protein [Opitutus sp. WL0086]WRQ88352.1 hypothetical protein K1X11_002975 [Opitutus sp. WL0086]
MKRLSWLAALTLLGATVGASTPLAAQQTPFLYGVLEDNRYEAPSGEYTLTLPSQISLGGEIHDTPEVVTLQDHLALHASVACFGLNLNLKRQDETLGRRDFLVGFFREHVQPQFLQRFAGAEIESARFTPELLNGALFVYNLLPGGSMFGERVPTMEDGSAPVAKRGNLLFLHNNHIYVLSLELAEKVLAPASFDLGPEEQNALLQKRLLELVGRMDFRAPLPLPAQPDTESVG